MLRTTFSRVRAAFKSYKSIQDPLARTKLDTLATTSFSPMNPGVTIFRPFPGDPESTQGTPKPAPNIAALTTASTSCSPINPGATLSLMSALIHMDTGGHQLGSRSRVLEDIPSTLKRFEVPNAIVLTRLPPQHPASSQAPSTHQLVKTPEPDTKMVSRTQPTAAVIPAPRPWFFKLPTFLRPRERTTYYSAFAWEHEAETKVVGKPNLIQYIMYGSPNPDGKMATAMVQKRTLWQSILYGVPEEEGEKTVHVAVAETETVKDVKVAEEDEKKAERNKTVDMHQGTGYGVMAK
ncbi:hypothetical protein DPSP01_005598 [Paraphaeosphaeria sporulosa]